MTTTQNTPKTPIAETLWRLALQHGKNGITADEIAAAFEGKIGSNTISPRLVELRETGLIARHPNNLTRPTRTGRVGVVWVANPAEDFASAFRGKSQKQAKPEARPAKKEEQRPVEARPTGIRPTASLQAPAARVLETAQRYATEPTPETLRELMASIWTAFGTGTPPEHAILPPPEEEEDDPYFWERGRQALKPSTPQPQH